MARTGLYQSEVKKARDALLSQGRHPSVDAVRVELGNTGSKTTIHKYLKELEVEDGGGSRKASISEALQDLVERLAARLQEEADERNAVIEAKSEDLKRRNAEIVGSLQAQLEQVSGQLRVVSGAADQEKKQHEHTRAILQAESIVRHTAEQQVANLKERLAENESHRLSLEEKHAHAREAIEHYRQSVKEQRDQDQRRHEQQVQQLQAEMRQLQQSLVVKQEDVTRLNQEGVRLVADLAYARQNIMDIQQASGRREAQLSSQLAAAQQQMESRSATVERQFMEARLELAGQERESALLNKEVRRLQGITDELTQEKMIWTQERIALEELARHERQSE
jgi:chromosome segregation ATPase